jgi:RNA polymerase sigma-70 factor (ECF subfamily)
MGRVLPLPIGVTPAGAGLLERCREGDLGAWREFYALHADRLGRFLARMGVPAADVEDVLQEVFVSVHAGLGHYDGRVAFKTWLYGVAMNHVRRHRRTLWRFGATRLGGFLGWSSDAEDPEHACALGETAEELHRILACLSEKKREVFVLYEVEGLDGPSIARILGCSVNTVWSRARLAREEFERHVRRARVLHGVEESA